MRIQQRVTTTTFVTLLSLALLLMPLAMQGQAVNATLVGTITDSTGAVVANATVMATEVSTGVGRSTKTNASGGFVFADMPPGHYNVTAEAQGFKKSLRSAVDVPVNTTTRVDMSLNPGAVSETVTVNETTSLLQTDRADVGTRLDSKQVTDLPLQFNHNFQSLLNLVPGNTRAHREHSEFFNAQDSLSTESNGQTRHFNNLLIEGVDNNERTGLLQVYIPPAEAIQTVSVTTNNYAAEFGRAGGAVTNVALKSGGNQYHGSLYEFNKMSALTSRAYFNRPPGFFPRQTYNYYGGTVGGPIRKNKTFFFADILHVSDVRGKFDKFTMPTALMRAGDFTEIKTLTSCQANAVDCQIYNPFTGNADGSNRSPFTCDGSGNPIVPNAQGVQSGGTPCLKIPSQLITTQAKNILALLQPYPTNLPGLTNNFQETTRFTKADTAFDVKLDQQWNDKDRSSFRFSRAVQNVFQQPAFGLAGGQNNGGFQGTGTQHQQSGALNHTHIFSPTLVMELRAGISHYRNIAVTADHGSKSTDAIGIPGANVDAFTSGMTEIEIGGFAGNTNPLVGYSASLPWDRGETNLNLVSNWTKIHGNHTFKWGADIRRLRDDLVQSQTEGPRGHFHFGTGTTQLNCLAVGTNCPSKGSSKSSMGNNFAGFLLDWPTLVGRDISVFSGSWRETEMYFFGQDTWRFTPKLTVDAGLRWELYLPPTPSHPGRYSNYDPVNNQLVVAGIGGNPMNLGRNTYYHYFAPRFGIAYRLTEKTVFRGGYGISYEPFPNNTYAFNFPVRQNNVFSSVNSFGPALNGAARSTMAAGFPAPQIVAVPSNGILPGCPAGAATTAACAQGSANFDIIDKKFQQPYVESYNLAIQRALPANFVLDVAYVGNHGVRIPAAIDLNAAQAPSLCTAAEIAGGLAGCAGKTTSDIQSNNCVVGASTRPLCNAFGKAGSGNFAFKPTTSMYNSLQVKLDHKFSHGLLMTTAYTWGKGLAFRDGTNDDGFNNKNYLDFKRNYGRTDFDRTQTFVQSIIYELPFGKGKPWLGSGPASWILGGWQISTILSRFSGLPLAFTASGTSLAASGTQQVPSQIAPFHVLGGIDTGNPWFDTTAFCQPGVTSAVSSVCAVGNGVLGNMTRHTAFSGPGYFNLDAGVFRRFPIKERVGLEFRAQAFSVTNTPHFNRPDTNVSSGTFGIVNSTGLGGTSNLNDGNRTVELGAKITF